MYPTTIGCHHHRPSRKREGVAPSHEVVTPHYVRAFTEHLRAAGYYCVKGGKNDFQFGHPFTVWNDHAHDPSAVTWRNRADEQPFFASFQNGVTHESGMWPPERDDRYGGTDNRLETDPDAVSVPPYLPDTQTTRRTIARHYDNLAAVDEWVGALLDELAADDLTSNTLVVLWSDHGEGLPRCKSWLYDRGLNVPLIIRWPGELDADEVTTELISLVDLVPTMLALADAEIPTHLQGRQFLGDERDAPRKFVFATSDRQDDGYVMQRAVRDHRFKYIRDYYPDRPVPWFMYRNQHPAMTEIKRLEREDALTGSQTWFEEPRPAEELYDLEADPQETENIVDVSGYDAVLDRLRTVLDEWRERTGDLGNTSEEQLVEQWWPDGEQPKTALPTFVPNTSSNPGRQATPEGGTFTGPMTVRVDCGTQGASVAYAVGTDDPTWQLYTGPIRLEPGETVTLRTKAIRYGYTESDERVATFDISE